MFPFDDPERGLRVLNMAVPFSDPGVTVHDNWNTLGMRGTASNDVTIDDVFVPDERVLADRPHGVVDPPLQVIASIAFPIVAAVYLGVAESAATAAIDTVSRPAAGEDASVQRLVGSDAQPAAGGRLGARRGVRCRRRRSRRRRWTPWLR